MDADTRFEIRKLFSETASDIIDLQDRVSALEERMSPVQGKAMREEKPVAQNCPKCGAKAIRDSIDSWHCSGGGCSLRYHQFDFYTWQRLRFAEEEETE